MSASTSHPVVIVSGPSGVGKGTVISALRALHPPLHLAVSATTRSPREGEVDGEHYHFITQEQFDAFVDNGAFLEYTNYTGTSYGTLASEVSEDGPTLIECDVEGAANLRKQIPQAVTVFLLPPSMDELERRLRGRGSETSEKIVARLARAHEEVALADSYDYQIVCEDVTSAAQTLSSLLSVNA